MINYLYPPPKKKQLSHVSSSPGPCLATAPCISSSMGPDLIPKPKTTEVIQMHPIVIHHSSSLDLWISYVLMNISSPYPGYSSSRPHSRPVASFDLELPLAVLGSKTMELRAPGTPWNCGTPLFCFPEVTVELSLRKAVTLRK